MRSPPDNACGDLLYDNRDLLNDKRDQSPGQRLERVISHPCRDLLYDKRDLLYDKRDQAKAWTPDPQ